MSAQEQQQIDFEAFKGHTPGPWTVRNQPYSDGSPYMLLDAGDGGYGDGGGFEIRGICELPDQALLAAAPALLGEVERLKSERTELVDALFETARRLILRLRKQGMSYEEIDQDDDII